MFYYEIARRKDDYRIEIIDLGLCDSFFRTGVSEGESGTLKCYADVTGYGSVQSYVEMPCKAALSVLIELMKAMINGMNRYILPWYYVVSTNTVFADRHGGSVKLIYVPREPIGEIEGIPRIMRRFCDELVNQIAEDERDAFFEAVKVFSDEGISSEDCLRELYKFQSKANAALDL